MMSEFNRLPPVRSRRVLVAKEEQLMHTCFTIDFIRKKVSKERIKYQNISLKPSVRSRLSVNNVKPNESKTYRMYWCLRSI